MFALRNGVGGVVVVRGGMHVVGVVVDVVVVVVVGVVVDVACGATISKITITTNSNVKHSTKTSTLNQPHCSISITNNNATTRSNGKYRNNNTNSSSNSNNTAATTTTV